MELQVLCFHNRSVSGFRKIGLFPNKAALRATGLQKIVLNTRNKSKTPHFVGLLGLRREKKYSSPTSTLKSQELNHLEETEEKENPPFVSFTIGSALLAIQLAVPFVAKAAEEASCVDAEFSETNPIFIIACVAEFIALTGAFVGGIIARRRKQELEVINNQLRQINFSLRKQARVESYAPGLSYAPVGTRRVQSPFSEEASPGVAVEKEEVVSRLKQGKKFLRQQNPVLAAIEFAAALKLAEDSGDFVEQKKAARGLGASYQRQGKPQEAIVQHQKVLEISKESGENSGETEAFGAIADCYEEVGDLETAAKYYDKYISRLGQN